MANTLGMPGPTPIHCPSCGGRVAYEHNALCWIDRQTATTMTNRWGPIKEFRCGWCLHVWLYKPNEAGA